MEIKILNTILTIIVLLILVYRTTNDVWIRNHSAGKLDTERDKPEDIIRIINYVMDLEMAYTVELPFEGKDVKRITDFEVTLHDLTNNTVSAFSKDFFERAKRAGFNEDYLLEYITRGCTTRILKYIQENNAGYAKPEDTEEE